MTTIYFKPLKVTSILDCLKSNADELNHLLLNLSSSKEIDLISEEHILAANELIKALEALKELKEKGKLENYDCSLWGTMTGTRIEE